MNSSTACPRNTKLFLQLAPSSKTYVDFPARTLRSVNSPQRPPNLPSHLSSEMSFLRLVPPSSSTTYLHYHFALLRLNSESPQRPACFCSSLSSFLLCFFPLSPFLISRWLACFERPWFRQSLNGCPGSHSVRG